MTTYQIIDLDLEEVRHEFSAKSLTNAIEIANNFVELASKVLDCKYTLTSK